MSNILIAVKSRGKLTKTRNNKNANSNDAPVENFIRVRKFYDMHDSHEGHTSHEQCT